MKNSLIQKCFALIVVVSISVISLVGCKKPTEGVDLIIDTQTNTTSLALQVVDAKTGEQITSTEALKITITGDDKSLVTNNIGKVDFTTQDGFLELYFSESKIPSSTSPIRFNVNVSATGYLANVIPVVVSSTGINTQKINLVKIQNAPDGVGVKEVAVSNIDNNCKMTADFEFEATPEASSFEKTTATITIPSGTVLQDANGKALKGNVSASMVYFNAQDPECLAAFPGCLNATTNKGEDIVFKSAGLVSLDLYASNGEVKRFSQPITMNFQIPSGVTDMEGKSVVEGTKIPAWSFDESTGKWTLEDTAVVKLNPQTNKLEASVQASHLSSWNLDWFSSSSCIDGATITIQTDQDLNNYYINSALIYKPVIGDLNEQFGSLFSLLSFLHPNGDLGYISQKSILIQNGNKINLRMTPSSASGALVVNDENYNGYVNLSNLCSGNYILKVKKKSTSNTQKINVTINGRCAANPGQIYRPTLPVYAHDVSKTDNVWEYIGNMVAGKFETSKLQVGKTYRFRTSLAGKTITSPIDITINQTEYKYDQEMPSTVCSYLSK
jgi:hypothetical protein